MSASGPMPTPRTEGSAAQPALPGSVTAAAVLLLIFGTLAGLATAFSILSFGLFSVGSYSVGWDWMGPQMDPSTGVLSPVGPAWWVGAAMFLTFGVIGAAVTAGHIAAGVGILQRFGWARILGMVVSGVALVLLGMGLLSMLFGATAMPAVRYDHMPGIVGSYAGNYALVMGAGYLTGTLFMGLVAAAYVYVLVVLARRGDVFDWNTTQQ